MKRLLHSLQNKSMVGAPAFFVVIIVVALLLRLPVIYKLAPTVDEVMLYGELMKIGWNYIPAHFFGFGHGENTLLGYLSLPFIYWFNLTPILVLRGIVLASNLIFIILMYFLAKRLFDEKVAYVSVLFAVIWPWSIVAGSVGYNVFLTLPMLVGAVLLLLKYKESKKLLFLYSAFILMALSLYAYALSFVWGALILLWYLIFIVKGKVSKHVIYAFLIMIILSIPILFFYLKNQFGIISAAEVYYMQLPELIYNRFGEISILNATSGINALWQYAVNYLLHLVLPFLSFSPAAGFMILGTGFVWSEWFYELTPGTGLFNPLANIWDPLLIVIGLVVLFRTAKYRRSLVFVLLWLLSYPLGSSLVKADLIGYTATRDVFGMPVLIMLSALGAVCIYSHIKRVIRA